VVAFEELKELSEEDLVAQRMDKYGNMGVYKE
jgi:acetyl-CoA carboxylase carboxyl transferase subunit alpha